MTPAPSSTSSRPALPEAWIGRLFTRLEAFYGRKLAEAFKGADLSEVQRVWAEELADYTAEELVRGVQACRRLIWPPTLPEFLLLCRPALDPPKAWAEAQMGMEARRRGEAGEWSHPAVWRAARRIGHDALMSGDYRRHASRWEILLDQELAKPRGDVPPAWAQVTVKPAEPVDPETAKRNLETLRQALRTAGITHPREEAP